MLRTVVNSRRVPNRYTYLNLNRELDLDLDLDLYLYLGLDLELYLDLYLDLGVVLGLDLDLDGEANAAAKEAHMKRNGGWKGDEGGKAKRRQKFITTASIQRNDRVGTEWKR